MQDQHPVWGCFAFPGISAAEDRQARSLSLVGVYPPELLTRRCNRRMGPGEGFVLRDVIFLLCSIFKEHISNGAAVDSPVADGVYP